MFRWGGEEFLLLCPELERKQAIKCVRRLIAQVAGAPFKTDSGEALQLTCSAGIASFPQDGETVRTLVSAADDAMYRAKGAGRNRIA